MKTQPKTEILRTRVSPEERERIEYKALSSYRTVSRYLRDSALDMRYDMLYAYVLSRIRYWSAQADLGEEALLAKLLKTGERAD